MASGARKGHRPMFPEFRTKEPTHRNLRMYQEGEIYDKNGEATKVRSFNDLANYVFDSNVMLFVSDIRSYIHFDELVDKGEVYCNARGVPTLARLKYKTTTRWIIQSGSWDSPCTPTFLKNLEHFFKYVGLGVYPTPGSLGYALLKHINYIHHLNYHTSQSLAVEDFLHLYAPNGVIATPGVRKEEYTQLLQMDRTQAWGANFPVQPDEAAMHFVRGRCEQYATYFARCNVVIKSELALSPFTKKGDFKERVLYPTLPGYYENVFLWKEQVERTIKAGCSVEIVSGYGWRKMTTEPEHWAKHTYKLRREAENEFDEAMSKKMTVSTIGHLGMSRDQRQLVPESRAPEGALPVLDETGYPMDIYIVKTFNNRSAFMTHWNKYTINMCNMVVYDKALPYAKEARLVAVYVDSITVLERGNERKEHISRKRIKEYDVEPGAWLWEEITGAKVHKNGWIEGFKDGKPYNRRPGYTEQKVEVL